MRRREFITLVGGAATWPVVARAQQATPVVGFLNTASATAFRPYVAAFLEGLKSTGHIDGQTVTIDYRWADGDNARLREFADEFVHRKVSVIVATGGNPPAEAAKAATSSTPIVFGVGGDPVRDGLVASLARPGGNTTGITLLTANLEAKRFGLLFEAVPKASRIAVLLNPSSGPAAASQLKEIEEASQSLGVEVLVLRATSQNDIQEAFAALAQQGAAALLVTSNPYFNSQRNRIAALAAQYRVPAIYQWREFAEAGGLMSYGTNLPGMYRQIGVYSGRILAGTRPGDLPVLQPTTFEFVINLKTAKTLGFEFPPTLLARADEVIE